MSDSPWYEDPNNIFKGPLLSNLEKTSEELAGVLTHQLNGFVPSGTSSDQWIRKMSLIVYQGVGPVANKETGLDLSQLRVNFSLKKMVNPTPNILYARIYNLSPKTEQKVKEFGRVSLSAGYQKNFGLLFDGTVVQYVQGKENAVDTYLDIWAGDGDMPNNNSVTNVTWPAGTSVVDKIKYMASTMEGVVIGDIKPEGGDEKSVRAETKVAMTRDAIRDYANDTASWYYIDNGTFHMIPMMGYREGQEVVLTPKTGLIGMPQVSPDGIHATCLINPKLRLGGVIQIRDNDGRSGLSNVPFIPGSTVPWAGIDVPAATGTKKFAAAPTSPTGRYTILLMEHHGDSRGTPWYTEMVCQATDVSEQKAWATARTRSRAILNKFNSTTTPVSEIPGGVPSLGPTPPPTRRR